MNGSASEVFEAALALSREERGKRAERLVQSLEGEGDADAPQAWTTEIERRLARNDVGESKLLSKDEAVQRLRLVLTP